MSDESLEDDILTQLKTLRRADSQATAVAWMTKTYKVLERCLEALKERPQQRPVERLVFAPERPRIEVVQAVPACDMWYAQARRQELQQRSLSQTVVYPAVSSHPGLKPLPKPWTREDTMRLVRAAKNGRPVIQRKGR